MKKTAVIIPCYNEQHRLSIKNITSFLENSSNIDLLFVNDGSVDGTGRVLGELSESFPRRVFVVDSEVNRGKAESIRLVTLSLNLDKYKFAAYWDADLATPLKELWGMIACLNNNHDTQLVMGSRVCLLGRDIQRRETRHYCGRIFATIVSNMLKLKVYDTQCGAKIFRLNKATQSIFRDKFVSKWFFDVELVSRFDQLEIEAKENRSKLIVEHPVSEWRDVPGSKLTLWDFLATPIELLKIYLAIKNHLGNGAPVELNKLEPANAKKYSVESLYKVI